MKRCIGHLFIAALAVLLYGGISMRMSAAPLPQPARSQEANALSWQAPITPQQAIEYLYSHLISLSKCLEGTGSTQVPANKCVRQLLGCLFCLKESGPMPADPGQPSPAPHLLASPPDYYVFGLREIIV